MFLWLGRRRSNNNNNNNNRNHKHKHKHKEDNNINSSSSRVKNFLRRVALGVRVGAVVVVVVEVVVVEESISNIYNNPTSCNTNTTTLPAVTWA